MNYRDCNAEIVEGLCQLIAAAQGAFPLTSDGCDEFWNVSAGGVDLADVQLLVDALHVLRPNMTTLALFDATLDLMHGRWREATQKLYQSIGEAGDDFRYGKAFLAFCLSQQGDAAWRPIAQEVLSGGVDDEPARLVLAIDAYVSFRDGVPRIAVAEQQTDLGEAKGEPTGLAGESLAPHVDREVEPLRVLRA